MKKLYKKWLGKALLALALIAPASMQAKTVYFENSENWSPVKVYAYGNNYNGTAWSGDEMTYDEATGYYKADVGDAAYVIFNNGSGAQTKGDNYDQSAVKDGYLYKLDGKDGDRYKLTSSKLVESFKFISWTQSGEPQEVDFTPVNTTTYTVTINSLPTNRSFKIVRKDSKDDYYSIDPNNGLNGDFDNLENGKSYTLTTEYSGNIGFDKNESNFTITLTWDGSNASVVFRRSSPEEL